MSINMGVGEVTSEKSKKLKAAFLFRLLWCNLVDWEKIKFNVPQFSSPLDIVAIDDQLDSGWDRILGILVGIPPENVKTMAAPITLMAVYTQHVFSIQPVSASRRKFK